MRLADLRLRQANEPRPQRVPPLVSRSFVVTAQEAAIVQTLQAYHRAATSSVLPPDLLSLSKPSCLPMDLGAATPHAQGPSRLSCSFVNPGVATPPVVTMPNSPHRGPPTHHHPPTGPGAAAFPMPNSPHRGPPNHHHPTGPGVAVFPSFTMPPSPSRLVPSLPVATQLTPANASVAPSAPHYPLLFYVIKGAQPALLSGSRLEKAVNDTGGSLVCVQNSRMNAAEFFLTSPSGEQIYFLGNRMNNFIVLRGFYSHTAAGSTFTTNPNSKQYLIVDGAAEVNVVGEQDEPATRLTATPLNGTRIAGAADSPLTPIRAGHLSIVFQSTNLRPRQLPTAVANVVKAIRPWRVALLRSLSPPPQRPSKPSCPFVDPVAATSLQYGPPDQSSLSLPSVPLVGPVAVTPLPCPPQPTISDTFTLTAQPSTDETANPHTATSSNLGCSSDGGVFTATSSTFTLTVLTSADNTARPHIATSSNLGCSSDGGVFTATSSNLGCTSGGGVFDSLLSAKTDF